MASTTESTTVPLQGLRWLRRLAFVAGGLAALVFVAWRAVPLIVRAQLESRLTEALGRATTVESVKFDPFKLQLTANRLAIADRAGPQPLLAIDALVADFSTASICHRAPVLDVYARQVLFADPDVSELVAHAFVPLRCVLDQELSDRFGLKPLAFVEPAVVFLDGDGKVVKPGEKPGQSGGAGLPEDK
jgi:hypothetical protein